MEHCESHIIFIFRKCQSLRSLTSCSTCSTVWRSCVSMESVCTLHARITPSFWPTSRRRCSSHGVWWWHITQKKNLTLIENICLQLLNLSAPYSNLFVFQSVVHVEVRVLPVSLSGCTSAPSCPLFIPWSRHLLEPHQHKLQQQRLENTIWSRWEMDDLLWCMKLHVWCLWITSAKTDYTLHSMVTYSTTV